MNNSLKLFKNINLLTKFSFLGLLCLMLIITPTAIYWNEANRSLVALEKEQRGLQPIRLMLNIIQRTQQHRATAARFLLDSSISKTTQRTKAEELEEAIFSYETYLGKYSNAEHRKAFERIVDYWHSIHQKVSRKRITFAENYDMHKTLLSMQSQYVQYLIDYYGLSHDSSIDTYLINISLMQFPELIDSLVKARGFGIGLLIKGKATVDDRAQLKAFMLMSEDTNKIIDGAFRKLELLDTKRYASSQQHYQTVKAHYEKTSQLVQAEILDKETFTYSRDDFYYAFTNAINGYYGCVHVSLDQLGASLIDRISSEKSQRNSNFFYIIVITLMGAIFYVSFVRRTLQHLGGEPQNISAAVEAMARGDLESDIEVKNPKSLLASVKHMQDILREGDQVKSEYIATATHELKIPLSSINSTLSLALTGQFGEIPIAARESLEIAKKHTLRLGELIDSLLDFNKLSVSKLELDLRVQPLMPIIEEAQLSMATFAQKHGVHIVLGPRFEYLLVKVDARRLRQVLKNLLSNAAKFSNKGEEIIINTTVHSDKVRIDIIDHGCGIGEELKEGLFQKYPQEIASDSSHTNSAGLGLVISKQLIEVMGGEIGFTSTLGIGSCFYIDLPLEEPNSD